MLFQVNALIDKDLKVKSLHSIHTCSSLAVNRIPNDLIRVVLRFLPSEEGSCAGVRCDRQVPWGAGQTLPHNNSEYGSGAGCAQTIICYALVVTCVFQCQLVNEEHSRALDLHSPERLQRLSIF